MHAPVDERAAAGLLEGGEGAADARDGAEGAERRVNVIDIAQLAGLYDLLYLVDRGAVAVAHADGEYSVGLI